MNSGLIIFWHLVFAFVGILIGIVIGYQWGRRSGDRSLPPIPEPKPVASSNPKAIQAGWTSDGNLWLEMNGIHLVNGGELNPDQRKQLANLLRGLGTWVEVEKAAEPAQTPTAAPVAAPKKAPVVKKEEPPVPPAMETIIQQINGVLQTKLASGALKERGIQLIEGPGGSVIVEDGIKRYEGIDAVPDAEVKSLIRESIAEWEKGTK